VRHYGATCDISCNIAGDHGPAAFIRDPRPVFGGVGHSGVGPEDGNFSREVCTGLLRSSP